MSKLKPWHKIQPHCPQACLRHSYAQYVPPDELNLHRLPRVD